MKRRVVVLTGALKGTELDRRARIWE